LKLLYEVFKAKGILDYSQSEIREQFCPKCDIKALCIKEKTEGKLSPLCLDGIATYCFKKY
jgi:hypothetical protein